MSEVLALPLPWRTVTNDRRVSVLAANGLVVTEIFGTAFYQRKQEIADLVVAAANSQHHHGANCGKYASQRWYQIINAGEAR